MMPPRAPRPDLVDTFVEMWLSAAVGFAALATAPLHAFRPAWPGEVEAGEDPDDEIPAEPSTVSAVRPSDLVVPAEAGNASTETCVTCRHFNRANEQAGECRHDAPFLDERGRAEWPITIENQWCGRFLYALVPGLTREDLDGLH